MASSTILQHLAGRAGASAGAAPRPGARPAAVARVRAVPRGTPAGDGKASTAKATESPLDAIRASLSTKATAKKAPAAAAAAPAPPPPADPLDAWAPTAAPVDPAGGAAPDPKGAIVPLSAGADGTACLATDDSLWAHADHFKHRWGTYAGMRAAIDANEGGLDAFSQGYKKFGFNRGVGPDGKAAGIWYREWAPAAKALALIGEFNNWTPADGHWAAKDDFGVWSLFLPDTSDGKPAIPHASKIKCRLETGYGEWVDRIPAWIKWATQAAGEIQFNGVHWDPPKKGAPGVTPPDGDTAYTFKYPRPPRPRSLRIYECHVGMSSADPKIATYTEFAADVLPRVRAAGYNCIQIMAVQEHAYYGSFGYHVTNFFAASSRCGTPEELKAMIDEVRYGSEVVGWFFLLSSLFSHIFSIHSHI
jgi:1,4-alpha-glucan branching enzyme